VTESKSETGNSYGLGWENHKEDVFERCKVEIPTLKMINGRCIWAVDVVKQTNLFGNYYTRPHILIEGDNYHALKVLVFTHAGKIDVIYIDPPYNTGNKDFLFNDVFVDKEGYNHSKWLSFMEPRLVEARKLLSDTGVIFISIDDNEQAQLRLLCDKVFGEENVEVMIWEKTGHGKKGGTGKAAVGKTFRSEHEYLAVVYKNKSLIEYNKVMELPNFKNIKKNVDNDPRGLWESGNISASNINNKESKKYFEIVSPSGKKTSRNWLITHKELESLIKDNKIYWGKNGDAIPRIKIFINEPRKSFPGSIIKDKGSLAYGKDELEEVLGVRMDDFTPKPTLLIKYLIKMVSGKNAVVLDFFAGSGTTGVATLELNKEDGGNRQFILCTNNEGNICTDVCYPRLKKIIEGYKTPKGKIVEGIPANLVYFTCGKNKTGSAAFMQITKNADPDTLKLEMAQHSTGIIKTIEGTYIEESISYVKGIEDIEYVLLRNGGKEKHGNKYVGIYYTIFDYRLDVLDELRHKMNQISGDNIKKILYYFTLEEEIPLSILGHWDNVEIKTFPKEFFEGFMKIIKKQ